MSKKAHRKIPNRKPKHMEEDDYRIERDHKHNHRNEQKFRNLLNTNDIDAILDYEEQF